MHDEGTGLQKPIVFLFGCQFRIRHLYHEICGFLQHVKTTRTFEEGFLDVRISQERKEEKKESKDGEGTCASHSSKQVKTKKELSRKVS